MLQKLIAAHALVICLLSGCVCSVHPILKDTDLTTDMDLSGTWEPKRSPVSIQKEQQERGFRKAYTFVATKFGDGLDSDYDVVWNGNEFHGQIGQIGDDYYLQLKRTELKPETAPLLHAVPVYTIARLKMPDNNTLEIFTIDHAHAPQTLKENELAHLRYTPSAPVEYFVLTGSTESMQAQFQQASEKLFTKQMLFVRAKESDEQ